MVLFNVPSRKQDVKMDLPHCCYESMETTLNAICGLACLTHKAQLKVMKKTNSESSETVKLKKSDLQAAGHSSKLKTIRQKSYLNIWQVDWPSQHPRLHRGVFSLSSSGYPECSLFFSFPSRIMERFWQPLLLLWLTVVGAAVNIFMNIAEAVEDDTLVWKVFSIYGDLVPDPTIMLLCSVCVCMIVNLW